MMYMGQHQLAPQILITVIKRQIHLLQFRKIHWLLESLCVKLEDSQQVLEHYEKVAKSPILQLTSVEIISYISWVAHQE